MSRSKYIYIAILKETRSPVLACTVKYEFIDWVEKLNLTDDEVVFYRSSDNDPYRRLQLSRRELYDTVRIDPNRETVDKIIQDRICRSGCS